MTDLITADGLTALLQVVMIDLVLAGDNAVVIGLAAASLPPDQRRRAILVGILAATALRILFAAAATQLLQVLGLLLVGGILLLWVCWKMWRELRTSSHQQSVGEMLLVHATDGGTISGPAERKTFGQAADKSWSRLSQCPWTTCSPWQGRHANTPSSLFLACCCPLL